MAQASKLMASSHSGVHFISGLNHQRRPSLADLPKSSLKPVKSNSKISPYTVLENSSATFRRCSVVKHIKFLGRGCSNLPIRDPHFSASAKSLERGEGGQPVPSSWIEAIFPEQARPYAYLVRLDKPAGTFLFAWPCMWSLAFTANAGTLPDLKMLAFFFLVSFMSRNIACNINDYFDKDFDSQVERTKGRPLASGAIAGFQALLFLAIQLLLGYGVLFAVNKLSRLLWVSSLPWIFTYPLMKRITYWPQAYLGLTISWGAAYSWAAVKGSLDPTIVFPLVLAFFFWTLGFDTIYAHQDKEDDVKVGIKSTALLFGDSTKLWISGFAAASIASLALTGFNANIGWPFYGLLAAASGHLAWQIWDVDLSNPADCSRKFVSNIWFGAIVFGAILCGRLFS
ncbi:4-hydroxybenzoate geranyltransferase 2-like [Coffea arabica]|uniref:4-hydroxybenzoate polyprenyltransferase, mitochondrial n=1 Tax=Coffea arabica TaxID=13443 RepID=A0A6P6XC12_COFAR|nr:4-hydroxybenzoate geranyltransferase 2-like [Coffea arabica]